MTYDKHDCDLMCERLAAYLERELAPDEQAAAARHLAECGSCAEVLAELRAITADAATMPLLAPSRDLWAGVASRISTPVTQFGSAPAAMRRAPRRPWQFAIAAAALIAATGGTTYVLTTRSGGAIAPAALVVPAPVASPVISPVANTKKELSAARVYDREIALLDSLVHTRRESLDPKTIAIIERNLRIIDKAIAESRQALARDPESPLLSNQLDNVLGSKVELLRTVAFLPSQS